MFAFLCCHVVTAITDTEIDAPIGTYNQSVHVVSAEGDTDAVAIGQSDAFVSDSVTVCVGQLIQFGNAGVVHLVVPVQYTGSGSVSNVVEPVGKHGGLVEGAIAVGIYQQSDAIMFFGVFIGLVAEMLPKHPHAIFYSLSSKVIVEPAHVVAVVLDTLLLPERLANEDSAFRIDVECDGVGHQRFRRSQ